MELNGDNLKIAFQKGGRLTDSSLQLLRASGIDYDHPEGRLFTRCLNYPLEILLLRHHDIPEYVQDGVTDLGVVGLNMIEERTAEVAILEHLGFGTCQLSIAVPKNGPYQTLEDLQGKRIATSYPRTLGRFLNRRKVSARVIEISGSVEIAPSLDVADAICDLVSTGTTLRLHELKTIEVVLKSESVLIANSEALKHERKSPLIHQLRARFLSHLKARQTKYVMLNAPGDNVDRIKAILPGMKSPTVVPLADQDMVAIHAAIPEERFWEIIERLRGAGATDMLVVPVEKIVD